MAETVTYAIANTADDIIWAPQFSLTIDTNVANGLAGGLYRYWAGLRFLTNPSAPPQGATIVEAYIDIVKDVGTSEAGSGGVIYGAAVDNAAPWTETTTPQNVPKTTASTAVGDGATQRLYVTAQVAEITARAGYAPGNAIAFAGDPTTATGLMSWVDYSGNPAQAAKLTIVWEAGGPPTLNALTLSPATTTEAAAVGATVGALSGTTSGSTLALTNTAGGRFSLDGSSVKVASALTVGTYSITVRETLDGATNTPRDTSLSITVTEAPPLSFVGSATGTTSATMPAHQAGDLILCWAYRDGSNTLPTLPSGQNWSILNGVTGANTNSAYLVAKVAASSSEAVGTFTSATSVVVQVYRPRTGYTATWGAVAANTGASTTVNYPALTLQTGDGSSWVAAFSGHRSTNTSLETPPAGMTLRSAVVDATDEAAGFDTNGGVAAWPSTNVSVGGTSSGWRSAVAEIVVAVTSTRRPPRHSFWL